MQAECGEGFSRGERDQIACREAIKKGIYVIKVASAPVIESEVGFCRFRVLSRHQGRPGKRLDFHGRLTNRALEDRSGSSCPSYHQDLQDQLNQRQQFLGVAMQKAIVSGAAKGFGQNMLQDKPQEVLAFSAAVTGMAGTGFDIFESDFALLIGDDIVLTDDASV